MTLLNDAVGNVAMLDFVAFDSPSAGVLFAPESLELFAMSRAASALLRDIKKGLGAAELMAAHQVDEPTLKRFLDRVAGSIGAKASAGEKRLEPAIGHPGTPGLPKFVMMVNNFCNLACTYCYEHESVFTQKAFQMPQDTARQVLDEIYRTFGRVREIMFIGGEPTLDPELIEFACQHATMLAFSTGDPAPHFSMVSNGVHLTDAMFATIERHRIQITFSIDGPKKVNDLVRIRHDGSGTYDDVVKNITRYRELFPEMLSAECTVSTVQHDAGVTVSDLLDFCAGTLGASEPHIAPVGVVDSSPLSPYPGRDYIVRQFETAAAKSVDNILDGVEHDQKERPASLDLVSSMLKALVRRDGALEMCPAGTLQLVVDAHGDLYPCWMFAGKKEFSMGNVLQDGVLSRFSRPVFDKVQGNTRLTNAQCSICYARYLCNPCVGNNQNTTGRMEIASEGFCTVTRAVAKTVILKIAEVRSDTQKWARLKRRYRGSRKTDKVRL